jgi:5-methylcytosine-specific restriction endonuclease McrA
LNESGIDVAYLQSIAEKSSCIPLLQRTEALFGNKGYTLRNDVTKKIHDLETRLHAGLDIDSRKGLRPDTIPNKSKSPRTRLLPPGLRDEILRRDKYRCIFCGAGQDESTTIEVHHIIPRSLIAKLNLARTLDLVKENLCTTCFRCNRGKSDNLAIEDVEFYLDAFSQDSHLNHAIVPYLAAIRRIQSIEPVTTATI